MRYYIVVEGAAGEVKIYPKWIQTLNNSLVQIYDLRDERTNAYYLVSGNGYPNYLKIIESAIVDMNAISTFDCLVVAADSEDNTYENKFDEIDKIIKGKLVSADYKIIVQHFCLEAWALGNRIACRKNSQDKTLLEYRKIYDVRATDPELLPNYKDMNRAQFAFRYLRCMLQDWYPGAVYTKSRPDAILDPSYFLQIKKRHNETGHIKSFAAFLDVFHKEMTS
jgi:hypothetical protein